MTSRFIVAPLERTDRGCTLAQFGASMLRLRWKCRCRDQMIFCAFSASTLASSYPIVASTSLVSAPSSGGARYPFPGVREKEYRPPPLLGADTKDVLATIGYDEARVEALK